MYSPSSADVMGSSMILTWEDTYCPSSGELYDFNVEGMYSPSSADVMGSSFILNWEGTYSPPFGEVVGSAMVLTWEGTSFPSSEESCWGALWFWLERARLVHHLGELYGLVPERATPVYHLGTCLVLYGFDLRCHVLSTIWGRAGELYGARHSRCNHYPVRAIIMLTF
jgi:hypothetical protein